MNILDREEFEVLQKSAAALIPEQTTFQARERGYRIGTADAVDEAAYVPDVRNALADVNLRLTYLESIASKDTP